MILLKTHHSKVNAHDGLGPPPRELLVPPSAASSLVVPLVGERTETVRLGDVWFPVSGVLPAHLIQMATTRRIDGVPPLQVVDLCGAFVKCARAFGSRATVSLATPFNTWLPFSETRPATAIRAVRETLPRPDMRLQVAPLVPESTG